MSQRALTFRWRDGKLPTMTLMVEGSEHFLDDEDRETRTKLAELLLCEKGEILEKKILCGTCNRRMFSKICDECVVGLLAQADAAVRKKNEEISRLSRLKLSAEVTADRYGAEVKTLKRELAVERGEVK